MLQQIFQKVLIFNPVLLDKILVEYQISVFLQYF